MIMEVTKRAEKEINRIESVKRKQIIKTILLFRNDPGSVDLRKLESKKNHWRIRVVDFRIILQIDWANGIAYIESVA
jgi:mRNA-degrading endonuclease RelE of RelBE toxin-antitoxin system